jgi:hypothetical protein
MTFEATGTGRDINGVLFECGQGHDLQGPPVGGCQHYVGGSTVVVGPQPIDSCHAPSVPGYQAGEPAPEHRGAQIVAHLLLVLEELSSHHRSDGVAATVLGTGMAAAVSKETGDRVIAEGLQRATSTRRTPIPARQNRTCNTFAVRARLVASEASTSDSPQQPEP